MRLALSLLSVACAATAFAQNAGAPHGMAARLSSHPPLSPAQVAELETQVQSNPSDIATRMRLLTHYHDSAPARADLNPAARDARLRHILYLIENRPEDAAAASQLAYVYKSGGPYADAADHEIARSAWQRAADGNPGNAAVQLNAARFLYIDHPDAAEDLLTRALDREPSNRRIASHLGFFYAMDILGMTGPFGPGSRTPDERAWLSVRARSELDRTGNPIVLAAAATALPNLFMRSNLGHTPGHDRTPFEYSSTLRARSQQLGAGDAELSGPMPMIREFQEFTASPSGAVVHGALTENGTAVRIGAAVQAAKLTEKPEPVYPPLALQARIQGKVRFNIVVSTDGKIENATLVSGHPLLVPAAQEALRQYQYQPTLLNGAPARVITQVDILFTF